MKQAFLLFSTSVFLFACADKQAKTSGEPDVVVKSATAPEAAPDSATMMNNWTAYMQPGKEHEMMASWNGEWNTEMTMWMSPDAPPSKTTGTTVNEMLMGGRYQHSVHKSTWQGAPFEGISTLAYDNAKKLFLYTWIDNMGTGIMSGEGPWDESTKSITIKGRMMDPGVLKEMDFREVFRIVDDNTQVMEMYAPGTDGTEFKSLEIRFTRKK